MEKIGSEIALRHVPARPIFTAGSYLHAKLAWHVGTVYHVPGICIFIEARSLVNNAPTWNKQSSELVTHSLAELVRVLGQGVLANNPSNVVSVLLGEGAPDTLAPYELGECVL